MRTHHQRLVLAAARHNIPLDVSIELTHHCNFRCQHCYIPDFHVADRLTTQRLFSLLEELAEMGTVFLTLTGGELFLRRDWLAVTRRARELSFAVRLISNGSLVDDDDAAAIRSLSAAVEISLYSTTEETFEIIFTRPKRNLVDLLEGNQSLEKLRPHIPGEL